MLKGVGVMLYNKHEEKLLSQYPIRYEYYIKEINDKISELEGHHQLSLF